MGRRVGLRAHGSWRNGEVEAQSERGQDKAEFSHYLLITQFAALQFISSYFIQAHPKTSHFTQHSAVHTDEEVHSIKTGTTRDIPIILLWAKLSHQEQRPNQRQNKPADGRAAKLPKC